jgi:hypothetical protein
MGPSSIGYKCVSYLKTRKLMAIALAKSGKRIMSFRDAVHTTKADKAGDGRVREEPPTAEGSIAKTLVGRNQG